MKRISVLFLSIFLISTLAGCYGGAKRTAHVGNDEEYKVELLFEIDGISVYRFMDGGNYVYFSSKASTFKQKQNGNTTIPQLQINAEEE